MEIDPTSLARIEDAAERIIDRVTDGDCTPYSLRRLAVVVMREVVAEAEKRAYERGVRDTARKVDEARQRAEAVMLENSR